MLKNSRQQMLIFLGLSSLLYVSLFLIEPLRKILSDTNIVLRNDSLFYLIVVILLVNLAVYLYFYHYANFSDLAFKKVFKYYLGLNLILLFIWPLGSSDIFSYIYQGRVWSIHQANPYLNTYSQFPQDAFYNLIANKWSGKSAPYGPLFVSLSGLLTYLGQASLWLSVYLFKALFIGAHLLTSYLIYKLSNLKTFFLYAFNPLIIFEFVVTGHNDALVALLLVTSFYFLKKSEREPGTGGVKTASFKKQLLACLFLVISTVIKQTTLILWPILGLLLLKRNLKDRRGIIFLISASGLSLLVIALAYAPFLANLKVIYQPLIDQANLLGSYSLGILFTFSTLIQFNQTNALSASLLINKLIFLFIYSLNFLKILFTQHSVPSTEFIRSATWVFLLFYLTCLSWLMPWYFTTLIIYSALSWHFNQKKSDLYVLYFFTAYGILYYIALR